MWFLIDLAPGTYAVGAYHDENNSSRLDTDFIGYPTDSDAAFAVGDEDAHVTLRIKY